MSLLGKSSQKRESGHMSLLGKSSQKRGDAGLQALGAHSISLLSVSA